MFGAQPRKRGGHPLRIFAILKSITCRLLEKGCRRQRQLQPMLAFSRSPAGKAVRLVSRDGEDVRHQVLDNRQFPPGTGQVSEGFLEHVVGVRTRPQAGNQVRVQPSAQTS